MKYTRYNLQEAVKQCNTWADMCRHFKVKPYSGSMHHIKKRCDHFEVSYDHFVGQCWARGEEFPERRRDLSEYLVRNGPSITTSRLRQRLLEEGLKYNCCEVCSVDTWLGQAMPLELHHINCDPKDNRLENLKICCPNCHTLEHHSKEAVNARKEAKYQRSKHPCADCRKPISRRATRCKSCDGLHRNADKIASRPSKEVLQAFVVKNGYCAAGRKWGVSDNTIRKWLK